ncbi:MAG: rod shape-determining protein RodA [Spirochaetaceae bacterium]|jgi:rod shape determining protein RodA|nr:rod shape-determining protein RodA [Spirochaetaceae bacterium]
MKIRDYLEADYPLFFAALLLTIIGILFIYSSGMTSSGTQVSNEYTKQIIWAVAGLLIALLISLLNYKRVYDFTPYLYGGIILLLLYTCAAGRFFPGSRSTIGMGRWISIGAVSIQPSEFGKIITILFLARYLDSTKHSRNGITRFTLSCVIVLVPMFIVLIQPDLGTALVFIPILLVMAFIGGIALRYVFFLAGCTIVTGLFTFLPLWQEIILRGEYPALMILLNIRFILVSVLVLALIAGVSYFGYKRFGKRYFYWICYFALIFTASLLTSFFSHKVLKEYQMMRLIVFLDPGVDPRGSGWHIIQSMTAIGSGGFTGKGFLQGTQSHYRFLPTQSTDFIYSIFTEEWGFVGGLVVIALFLLICFRLIRLMKITSDTFGAYIAAGLAAMYGFHFLVNTGMAMGIMPITGIPLLFMSYGGSALFTAMAGIGLAMSIHIRRFDR